MRDGGLNRCRAVTRITSPDSAIAVHDRMKHYPQRNLRLHLRVGEVRLKECPLKRLRISWPKPPLERLYFPLMIQCEFSISQTEVKSGRTPWVYIARGGPIKQYLVPRRAPHTSRLERPPLIRHLRHSRFSIFMQQYLPFVGCTSSPGVAVSTYRSLAHASMRSQLMHSCSWSTGDGKSEFGCHFMTRIVISALHVSEWYNVFKQ